MNVATRDQKVVTVAGFSSGSVNAFVEVIIVKPHQVQNYKDLADAIINAGELDENGFLTITRANGDTIVLDSNRLDVDGKHIIPLKLFAASSAQGRKTWLLAPC